MTDRLTDEQLRRITDRLTDEQLTRITDTGYPVPRFTPDELRAQAAEILELRERVRETNTQAGIATGNATDAAQQMRQANATLDKIAAVINRPEMPGAGLSTAGAVGAIADELEKLRAWRDDTVALMRRATHDPKLWQLLFESGGADLAVSLTRVLDERDRLREVMGEIATALNVEPGVESGELPHIVAERLRDRIGRCTALAEGMLLDQSVSCELPHGHPGMHYGQVIQPGEFSSPMDWTGPTPDEGAAVAGVWVVAIYGDMGQFSSLIPCLTELDALRELNTNWRDWGSSARVVFVPFGTDVQEVCK